MTGPSTEKWALVDVAHNNTRGSSQRLREKREKIRQATHRPSSEIKEKSVNGAQSLVSEDKFLQIFVMCDYPIGLDNDHSEVQLIVVQGIDCMALLIAINPLTGDFIFTAYSVHFKNS